LGFKKCRKIKHLTMIENFIIGTYKIDARKS
jgi:hypothetical protein